LISRLAPLALTLGLAVLAAPFLAHCLAKVPLAAPIDYNEGWNAYHTARLIQGGPLYPPVEGFPVTPVNYPPLSFLIVGTIARGTGRLVLTGRLLSLASLAAVGYLTFRTVIALTASRLAGAVGALLWLGLVVRLAPAEVGSYDGQMLGHAFNTGALYLHTKWRTDLGRRRIWLLATLCCLGLFVKQLLLAVPLALGIALLIHDRRRFRDFVLASLALLACFAVLTRLLGGEHVLANLLAFERQMDAPQRLGELGALFFERGGVVLLCPVVLLFAVTKKDSAALLAYAGVSLALGIYAAGGVGIDRNAWLDFFLAAALALGTLVGKSHLQSPPRTRALVALAVITTLVPVAAGSWEELGDALAYSRLEREEQAYLADVELLRGVPGPVLVEEPLLGFDAGKEFLFDPFSGSQMILSGRLPESILTDRLRRKEFAAVVLTSRDVEEARRRLERRGRPATAGPPRRVGWWTRGTLEAVRDHYVLHAPDRRRYAFFYFPSPS
jgi:hypothetical protein